MKFRRKTFDREVKEWLQGKEMREFIGGRKGFNDFIYVLIKTVDKGATLPSWFGAYQKNFKMYNDIDKAVKYADGVVRRTQPAGHRKDLAAIMRGSNTKKLFTMFYTHFTNTYNQMANEWAKARMGEKAPLLKAADLLVAYWWLLIVPGIFATELYKFGKASWKDLAKGIASYGLNSIAIVGNMINSWIMTKFDYSPSAAFGGPKAAQMIFKAKKPRTKLKYAITTLGYATGLPAQQGWITLSGLFDLATGRTSDLRRLGFSEYQLKEKKVSINKNPVSEKYGIGKARMKNPISERYGIK